MTSNVCHNCKYAKGKHKEEDFRYNCVCTKDGIIVLEYHETCDDFKAKSKG